MICSPLIAHVVLILAVYYMKFESMFLLVYLVFCPNFRICSTFICLVLLKILGLDQVSILSYGGLFKGCSVTGDLITIKV